MTSADGLASAATAYDAIVLAGGRGSRLGGVDKGALVVGRRSLLATALDACGAARRTVVVGPGPLPAGTRSEVILTREEPAYAGPAAAVVAGLRALAEADRAVAGGIGEQPSAAGLTLLLACDLPRAEAAVTHLLAHVHTHVQAQSDRDVGSEVDGWCLAEADGREQWLLGLYRTAELERAVAELGDPTDRSLGRLLGRLRLATIAAPAELTADIDTPEDAARLRG